jgi:DNA polymerase-3 subunit delta'
MDFRLPFVGHERQQVELAQALTSGRLAASWVFTGPRGVGKMTLAQRFAARLLGLRPLAADKPFDLNLQQTIAGPITSGSHPDYRETARQVDEKGKSARNISVEQIRDFTHFFSLTASEGCYRVGLIDSADDFNPAAANALLKTLEEPPPRSCLILIHHGDAPLLPTLLSRCRRLRFDRLSTSETETVLRQQARDENSDVPAELITRLAKITRGQPGLAVVLSDPKMANAIDDLISSLEARTPDPERLLRLISLAQAGSSEDREAFQRAINLRLTEWARTTLLQTGSTQLPREAANRLLKGWREVQHTLDQSQAMNLAPDSTMLAIIKALRDHRVGA